MSVNDICRLTRKVRQTIYRWVNAGLFPSPSRYTRMCIGFWSRSDIEKFLGNGSDTITPEGLLCRWRLRPSTQMLATLDAERRLCVIAGRYSMADVRRVERSGLRWAQRRNERRRVRECQRRRRERTIPLEQIAELACCRADEVTGLLAQYGTLKAHGVVKWNGQELRESIAKAFIEEHERRRPERLRALGLSENAIGSTD